MPGKAFEIHTTPATPSETCSPTPNTPMATPLRKVLDRLTGFTGSWSCGRRRAPRGRRIYHNDADQQDEFQHANTRCLSSYYSVFVARLAIMVMLAILIGLLTILTWHFTTVYTTKSLNTLAYGLRYELLQRPILRMWNILNSTAEITAAQVKLSEYVFKRYSNPATQAEQIELYEMMRDVTWALFASRKALNAITINYKNGFVQAFHRDHRSNNTFYIYSDLSNYSISAGGSYDTTMMPSRPGWDDQSIKGNVSATWYREPLDPNTGDKIGKARPIPPDDLINIAGISQVPDGAATWHVAVSKFTDSPLLSAALPVSDPSNESIVAVVGVTTALYSVGQLMKELVEVHSGHIYLTSQEGFLLATSTNAPLLTNLTTGPKLVMATDSEDHVIKMGARWLERVYGNKFPPGHIVHVEAAKLGSQDYYIDSFFLNLKRLPIVGVIIIPRGYIMGKADERALKTLVILISASVCILIIGCLCILILTNGVSKEMKLRAELISHLDARRRAEASNNYKSQFLANMSHELRTPMAAVIGLLDILIADVSVISEHFATLSQIRKCSTALLRLLNNILDLSKVESGKLVLEEADFNLGHELEGLLDMYSVQCLNQNVETVLDLSDDMPDTFRGDSARIVQIFSNLISNSIKFTTSGHIVIRGWCEDWNSFKDTGKFLFDQKKSRCVLKTKLKQQEKHVKTACKKDNKMILWFEIDDTGCGIDPSKWETVFESFEQADPSTTRLHGGTGLGLCIVRTLVKKMGGEIKVVKKDTPGTLMRLYLLLNTPSEGRQRPVEVDFSKPTVVLLALLGRVGREVMSQWLRKNKVSTLDASDWSQLTQILPEVFHSGNQRNGLEEQRSLSEPLKDEILRIKAMEGPVFIIVVDIGLLDFRKGVWLTQLDYLGRFTEKAKFAWTLNHDSSNVIKMELRRRGHVIVVNKPLYRGKMIQILEAALQGRTLEVEENYSNAMGVSTNNSLACSEIDSLKGNSSSEDSDKLERNGYSSFPMSLGEKLERIMNPRPSRYQVFMNHLIELTQESPEATKSTTEDQSQTSGNIHDTGDTKLICSEQAYTSKEIQCSSTCREQQPGSSNSKFKATSKSRKANKHLQGLHILLVEDTMILQRVAAKMLERMGARVYVVGDGLQAVEALNTMISAEMSRREAAEKGLELATCDFPQYDLVLMDCQMPKMDGYEATKEIRRLEMGTGLHTPIVALTAHAMSSDEAKCLSVGMDAYLTKPIDTVLMVDTILRFVKDDDDEEEEDEAFEEEEEEAADKTPP